MAYVTCPACKHDENRVVVMSVSTTLACRGCGARIELPPQERPWAFRGGLVDARGARVIEAGRTAAQAPKAKPRARRTDPRVAVLAFVLLLAVVGGAAAIWAKYH